MIKAALKLLATIFVGGYLTFILDSFSRIPRDVGVPVAWVLVVALLSFWWLYFITPEV